jgi:ubiquitin thioesterase protein OTUB1
LVAAIWICSHSEEFEPLIPELNEGYTLTDVSITANLAWVFRLLSSELANASFPENLTLILFVLLSLYIKQWCSREVIQRKVFTDHIQIIALVRALGVPLRVEYLFQEVGQDLYTGQTSEDDISICICLPCHHHVLPPAHQVPRVTVLYSDQHYDVIYPYCADGKVILTDVRSSQQSDKIECPTAAKSPSQHQGSSYSDEKSSQRLTG